MKGKRTVIIFTLLLLSFLSLQLVHAQTPFTLSVEPETGEASPGDYKEYTITIDADPSFTDSVILQLEIVALTYNETYQIGIAEPPYPTEIIYNFPVPEDVPGDVTAYGTITGISGNQVVEKQVTLNIRSGGFIGSIIGWVLSILNRIRNIFS